MVKCIRCHVFLHAGLVAIQIKVDRAPRILMSHLLKKVCPPRLEINGNILYWEYLPEGTFLLCVKKLINLKWKSGHKVKLKLLLEAIFERGGFFLSNP